MKQRIKVLSESLANQIAAGEVVQRPASAVKELLENALDAGAGQITLTVRDGGRSLIQVSDDGQGMNELDARLSIERHATSKLTSIDDLYSLRTMGFRGEALASIAAVSQLEIKTREEGAELATLIRVNGGDQVEAGSEASAKGTVISVRNLFYNVPARRNFLKNDAIENRHIIDAFQQVALSRPEVAFTFVNNGEEIHRLERSSLHRRIIQLFGKKMSERLIPVEEETDIVNISGYAGKPEFATARKSEQFFLVNSRYIRSPYLHHAVAAAYEDLLPGHLFPQYFIHLEVDPSRIDVNIHPTKTEIKFLEERSIYAILRTCIRRSLGMHNLSPSLDFERETAFDVTFEKDKQVVVPVISVDPAYNPFKMPDRTSPGMAEKAMALYEDAEYNTRLRIPDQTTIPAEKLNQGGITPAFVQYHGKYLVGQGQSGLIVIDQHRAHRRIIFEKLLRGAQKALPSQKLLFPVLIELSAADMELARELIPKLSMAGIAIDEFGGNSLSVSGAPAGANDSSIDELITGLIEDYRLGRPSWKPSLFESICDALSVRMAIKAGKQMEEGEIRALTEELFACEMPYRLRGGKPVMMTIGLDELSRKFQN